MSILFYGYGNPNRCDDGLASEFIDMLDSSSLDGYASEWNYQLNIEDSAIIAEYDTVIFVDATREDIGSFSIKPLEASASIAYSTHAMDPESVLALCHKTYDKYPQTSLLEIAGYEWSFEVGLSEKALINLNSAFDYVKENWHCLGNPSSPS